MMLKDKEAAEDCPDMKNRALLPVLWASWWELYLREEKRQASQKIEKKRPSHRRHRRNSEGRRSWRKLDWYGNKMRTRGESKLFKEIIRHSGKRKGESQ